MAKTKVKSENSSSLSGNYTVPDGWVKELNFFDLDGSKAKTQGSSNQNQIDSCADFCYNDGPVHLATMLHHGWDQIPAQMPAWVYGKVKGVETKIPGLVVRRAAEVTLFNTS